MPSVGDKLREMKPIRNTLTARVGMLKLYREEVDELVGFFRDGCQIVLMFLGMSHYFVVEPNGEQKMTPPALLILLVGLGGRALLLVHRVHACGVPVRFTQ